jgi:hypothetical protein
MSMSQPVSCEARRTFWPRRPIASESCSSGTTTSMRLVFVEHDLATSAGASALTTKVADVGRPRNDVDLLALQFVDHGLHARAAHTDAGADRIDEESREITAILAREPGSRATALISMMPS